MISVRDFPFLALGEDIVLNKILVAVDPQGFNTALVDQSISLASATGADLKLISILTGYGEGTPSMFVYPGLTGYPPVMEDSLWQDYQERYETYAKKSLDKLRHLKTRAQAAGVSTDTIQLLDSPGRAICEEARQWKADLIIVGSHGRRGLSEIFLGSVSNYVMHHAACSVMVVHNPEIDKDITQQTAQVSEPMTV